MPLLPFHWQHLNRLGIGLHLSGNLHPALSGYHRHTSLFGINQCSLRIACVRIKLLVCDGFLFGTVCARCVEGIYLPFPSRFIYFSQVSAALSQSLLSRLTS